MKEVLDIDLLSLKRHVKQSFYNDDDFETAEAVDKITEKDVFCERVGRYQVYLLKTSKGYIWKQGILVSYPFKGVMAALKDARQCLL